MKEKRERKHNFTEVENEITYAKSIVNKSREENLIHFCNLQSKSAKLNFFLCI